MITWSKGRPRLELEPLIDGFTVRLPLVEEHLCLVKTDEPGEYDTVILYPVWGLRENLADEIRAKGLAGTDGATAEINKKSNYRFRGWKTDSSLRGPVSERFLPREVAYWTTIDLPK